MLDSFDIQIISHASSIRNHPVSQLPMPIRENYLQGLRAMLPMENPAVGVLFKALESSIIGKGQTLNYDSSNPKANVKMAVKVNRIRLRWFRLTYPFFFDCLYLSSLCNDPTFTQAQYKRLRHYCNLFTKTALRRVYRHFVDKGTHRKIPAALLEHKQLNERFQALPLTRILVVANVSAGKSTLINALVGRKLNKTATGACTKDTCMIFNKPQEDGLTIRPRNTKTFVFEEDVNLCASDESEAIGLNFISDTLKGQRICFIDTPGFNDVRNPGRYYTTEQAIRRNDYDAVMYVANASYMGRVDEQYLLEDIVRNTRKPIIFVMNCLDRFKPSEDSIEDSIKKYREDLFKLGLKRPLIVPVSARLALLTKLRDQGLLDEEDEFEWEMGNKRFANDFFDLSWYVKDGFPTHSEKLIDRTGITYLEQVISG